MDCMDFRIVDEFPSVGICIVASFHLKGQFTLKSEAQIYHLTCGDSFLLLVVLVCVADF